MNLFILIICLCVLGFMFIKRYKTSAQWDELLAKINKDQYEWFLMEIDNLDNIERAKVIIWLKNTNRPEYAQLLIKIEKMQNKQFIPLVPTASR